MITLQIVNTDIYSLNCVGFISTGKEASTQYARSVHKTSNSMER